MRAKHFLLEYNRDITIRQYGRGMYEHFMLSRDSSPSQSPEIADLTQSANFNFTEVVSYILRKIEQKVSAQNQKYIPWIVREYSKSNIKLIEDISAVDAVLIDYTRVKNRADFPEQYKNIYNLSVDEFFKLMVKFTGDFKQSNKGSSKELYRDEDVRVIHPLNQDAACYYGQGTRWCTAATKSENYFESYNKWGPLYILIPTKPEHEGEKYQIHLPTKSFENELNNMVEADWLLMDRFPKLLDFFKRYGPAIKDILRFMDTNVMTQIVRLGMNYVRQIIIDPKLKSIRAGTNEQHARNVKQAAQVFKELEAAMTDPKTFYAAVDETSVNLEQNMGYKDIFAIVSDNVPMNNESNTVNAIMNSVLDELRDGLDIFMVDNVITNRNYVEIGTVDDYLIIAYTYQ